MENETLNATITKGEPNTFSDELPVITIFVAALSVVGFIGNVTLMGVTLRYKHMQTSANVLIFNLAVADLLYIVVTTPIYVESKFDGNWGLPLWFCKVKSWLEFVVQYASAFAVTALSRERYSVIVKGIESRSQSKKSWVNSSICAVVVVWAASFLLNIPTLVFAHVKHYGPNASHCWLSSPDKLTRKVYKFIRLLIGYAIPLIIVAFYYVRIAVSLCRSTKRSISEHMSDAEARQMRQRRRLVVIVLTITVFFAVCWFPYYFNHMWIHLIPYDLPDVLNNARVIMPVVNTCLDPWLIFAISSKHRACLVGCLWRRRQSGDGGRSTRIRSLTTQTSRLL